MTMRIGILDRLAEVGIEQGIFGDRAEALWFRAREPADLPDEIGGLHAAIVWHELAVTEDILARLTSCRAVIRAGVGYDSVDLGAAGRLGIAVLNVPDYGTNDVADHTLALLLGAVRRLPRYEAALRIDPHGGWSPEAGGRGLRRLTNRTVGIVGFGRIGSAVAHRLRAFGCRVGFFDPYVSDGVERAWQVRRFATLDALLAKSQIVTLHAPLTEETRGILDRRAVSAMPADGVLLNTSRGELVDLDAVHDAVRDGHLAAFAADVLPVEPPDRSHPLIQAYAAAEEWTVGRIVLTPHAAFYSEDCERDLREKAARAALDVVTGKPLRNCVNERWLRSPRAAVAAS